MRGADGGSESDYSVECVLDWDFIRREEFGWLGLFVKIGRRRLVTE